MLVLVCISLGFPKLLFIEWHRHQDHCLEAYTDFAQQVCEFQPYITGKQKPMGQFSIIISQINIYDRLEILKIVPLL